MMKFVLFLCVVFLLGFSTSIMQNSLAIKKDLDFMTGLYLNADRVCSEEKNNIRDDVSFCIKQLEKCSLGEEK